MSEITQALRIIRLEAENARLVADNARLTQERDAAYAAADKFAKLLHDESLGVERAPLDEIARISFEGQMRGDVD